MKHIKIRWLTLYTSLERLLQVFTPIKDYFLSIDCPVELREFFSSEEAHCVLCFLEHILHIIQKSNLKLQRRCSTAVSLHQIITELKFNLQQRLNSLFFGTSCRLKLSRLQPSVADKLKNSFARFIEKVIEYIDEYYLLKKKDKKGNIIEPKDVVPALLCEAISPFGLANINDIKWNQITKCIDLFQIENINENDLFNEFTEIQMTFKYIQDKNIPLYDQVQSYINKKINLNISAATAAKTSSNTHVEEKEQQQQQDDDDDDDDLTVEGGVQKEIRPDQLWAMLLSVKPTPSPNLYKFISFIFSIPCSNAYVESVFSIMKHLYDDQRNRMSTERIAAELKIRLNSSLSCTEIYDFLLSKPELLKLIHSNEKYCAKKQRVN